MISDVNESKSLKYAFEWFKGILFENGRRYAKSEIAI